MKTQTIVDVLLYGAAVMAIIFAFFSPNCLQGAKCQTVEWEPPVSMVPPQSILLIAVGLMILACVLIWIFFRGKKENKKWKHIDQLARQSKKEEIVGKSKKIPWFPGLN